MRNEFHNHEAGRLIHSYSAIGSHAFSISLSDVTAIPLRPRPLPLVALLLASFAVTFASLRAQTNAALPVVTAQPADVTEVVGGNVAFVVAARGASPLTFQWRRNGVPLAGATGETFFLPAIQMATAGSYDCMVANSSGSLTTAAARLTVLASNPLADPLDSSFAPELTFSPSPTVAALQADGKILLGGQFAYFNQGRPQSGLARLNADGSLDSSFAPGVLSTSGSIALITVQPDGKIIIGGNFSSVGGITRRNLARLNSDGTVDSSLAAPSTVSSQLRQVELTSDGRLLLVDGSTTLLRLNADGSTDPAWRFSPIQVLAGSGTSVNPVTSTVERIALLADGQIAVVAMTPLLPPSLLNAQFVPPPPPSQFSVLIGLNADGSSAGRLSSDGIPNFPRELRSLPDGSLLLASTAGGLQRFSRTGSTGSYQTSASASVASTTCVAIASDGHVWLGGSFSSAADSSGPLFSGVPSVTVPRKTLARLNADFSIDRFDPGLGLTDANGATIAPRFVLALPDGRAVIGGDFARVNGVPRPQFARLRPQSPAALNPPAILDVAYREPREGEPYIVTIRVTGSPPFFFPAGYTYNAATGSATFTLTAIGLRYTRAANPLGASALKDFTVRATPSIPVFMTQPAPVQTNTGRSFALGLSVAGTRPFSYQWFKNGAPLIGEIGASYSVTRAVAGNAGEYHVVVRNALGAERSESVRVGIDETARLINFSARGAVSRSEPSLVIGFATRGIDLKGILIRGVGQTLSAAPFNISGSLADPMLSLHDATGARIYTNDEWFAATNATALAFQLTGRSIGAFDLLAGSRDSAGLLSLESGAYTAVISASSSRGLDPAGIVLGEIYETDLHSSRLVNLSARASVLPGSGALIAGFVIAPVASGAPKKLLIRGVGPALTAFGVSGELANPILSIIDSTGRTVATNDDWETNTNLPELRAATTQLAFPLAAGSRDAALLVTLAPGAYTCIVSGVNNTSGTALVEVYEVP